jgi:hypothetical protein
MAVVLQRPPQQELGQAGHPTDLAPHTHAMFWASSEDALRFLTGMLYTPKILAI